MLVEMGFDADSARNALIQFRNNLDLAMNYLLSGNVPDMSTQQNNPE
jgi:uncharacterized UBP type Zn finger protein